MAVDREVCGHLGGEVSMCGGSRIREVKLIEVKVVR